MNMGAINATTQKRVQFSGCPGKMVHPSRKKSSMNGSTRLRRRLSVNFHAFSQESE